jgi:hypothetical protein
MDASTLHTAIVDAGCPTISCTVVDPVDRATWTFIPEEGNTQAQIDIGNNVIATIPAEVKSTITPSDFIARWTNAEYLALEKKRAADIAANKVGNAKNWDNVTSDGTINMNKKKVQTLKSDLVTDGILTQARADIIFS